MRLRDLSSAPVQPRTVRPQNPRDSYAQMRRDIVGLSKKDTVAVIMSYLPNRSSSWVRRHLDKLTKTPPDELASWLSYPDPTGSKAVRNVMRNGGGRRRG